MTRERPNAELARYLATRGATVPVYHEVRNEASRTLGFWGTPEYYVLDGAGRLRFSQTDLARAPAQAAALWGE